MTTDKYTQFIILVKSDILIKKMKNSGDYSGVNKRITQLRKEIGIPDFRYCKPLNKNNESTVKGKQ